MRCSCNQRDTLDEIVACQKKPGGFWRPGEGPNESQEEGRTVRGSGFAKSSCDGSKSRPDTSQQRFNRSCVVLHPKSTIPAIAYCNPFGRRPSRSSTPNRKAPDQERSIKPFSASTLATTRSAPTGTRSP